MFFFLYLGLSSYIWKKKKLGFYSDILGPLARWSALPSFESADLIVEVTLNTLLTISSLFCDQPLLCVSLRRNDLSESDLSNRISGRKLPFERCVLLSDFDSILIRVP